MKKWWLCFVPAMGLIAVACSSAEGPKEEERYRIAEASSVMDGGAAKCEQAKKTRDAYLRDGDAKAYDLWQIVVYTDCR